jgi:hypothetical protein
MYYVSIFPSPPHSHIHSVASTCFHVIASIAIVELGRIKHTDRSTAVIMALRLLVLTLVALPCSAFSPVSTKMRQQTSSSLGAAPTPSNELVSTRRSFIHSLTTATTISTFSPLAFAEETPPLPSAATSKRPPLPSCIYNILRVREATEQETRLITTGKFKDVQRANVKLAVKFMVNNYKLSDSVIAASSYLTGNARVSASGVGSSAVQSLYTILEYFDSSDVENIKVGSDSIAGKETIVIKGLESVRRDIDEFLTYFPQDIVEEAKKKIAEENELNFREFDPVLGVILNPNPTK